MKRKILSTLTLAALAALFIGSFGTSDTNAQDEWGHLTGQIVVSGDVPEQKAEEVGDSPDKKACLVDGKVPVDDGIIVNDKKQLKDVFVLMYTGRGAETPEKFHPSYAQKKTTKLTLDNQKCRFVPKAVFARSGQTLILKNSDDVGHNCHITTFNQEHNVNIPPKKEVELKLENEEDKVPGEVRCDIHKWMDSVIFIRDNPYVAITDAEGKFKIENLPAGDWKFQFWHKKAGYLKTVEIKGYEPDRKGVIEATITKDKALDLGTLTLPAAALSK